MKGRRGRVATSNPQEFRTAFKLELEITLAQIESTKCPGREDAEDANSTPWRSSVSSEVPGLLHCPLAKRPVRFCLAAEGAPASL